MDAGTLEDLRAIYGSDANNIWIAGLYGGILKWDGAVWKRQDSGMTQWLYDVWASSTGEVFMPAGGQILHKR